MSVEALDLIRARSTRFAIACDWRDRSLGVTTRASKACVLLAGADPLAQA